MSKPLPKGVHGPVELSSGHQIFWAQLSDDRFHAWCFLLDYDDDKMAAATGEHLEATIAHVGFMVGRHCYLHPESFVAWRIQGCPGRYEPAQA